MAEEIKRMEAEAKGNKVKKDAKAQNFTASEPQNVPEQPSVLADKNKEFLNKFMTA